MFVITGPGVSTGGFSTQIIPVCRGGPRPGVGDTTRTAEIGCEHACAAAVATCTIYSFSRLGTRSDAVETAKRGLKFGRFERNLFWGCWGDEALIRLKLDSYCAESGSGAENFEELTLYTKIYNVFQ